MSEKGGLTMIRVGFDGREARSSRPSLAGCRVPRRASPAAPRRRGARDITNGMRLRAQFAARWAVPGRASDGVQAAGEHVESTGQVELLVLPRCDNAARPACASNLVKVGAGLPLFSRP